MFDIEKYIAYFSSDETEFIIEEKCVQGKMQSLPYPDYDIGLHNFIIDIYESDLLVSNYDGIIEGEISDLLRTGTSLEDLDYKSACAVLTWIVRSDRFAPLSLGREAENGNMARILIQVKNSMTN